MKIYGIYDKQLDAYWSIYPEENDDMAKRYMYRLLESNNNSDLVKFPQEFAVYALAYYDNKSGNIDGYDVKKLVFELFSLFKRSDQTLEEGAPE